MSTKAYIVAMAAIFNGVFFSPWFDEAFKLCILALIVVLTLVVNIAVRIPKIWEIIIDRIVNEALQRVLMDPDLRKVVLKMHREQLKALKKGNENVRKA